MHTCHDNSVISRGDPGGMLDARRPGMTIYTNIQSQIPSFETITSSRLTAVNGGCKGKKHHGDKDGGGGGGGQQNLDTGANSNANTFSGNTGNNANNSKTTNGIGADQQQQNFSSTTGNGGGGNNGNTFWNALQSLFNQYHVNF